MAIKHTKRKVASKKDSATIADIVVVGNYKTRQLEWIKKNGVYNWPVREDDGHAGRVPLPEPGRGERPARPIPSGDLAKVRELWLYANVKSGRYVFTAQFVGKMTKAEFLAAYPSYAKLGPSKQKAYYVFTAKPVDYPSELGGQIVIARAADFGGYSAKVKKAILQFKQDGEFAPLAAYLPKELGKVPRPQLRVCEAAVQLDFFPALGDLAKPDVPFPPVPNPSFTFIDLFAGIGGFRLAMQRNGGRCVFSSEWNESAQKTYAANYGDTPFGDITKDEIKNLIPEGFDILCAGFPCQPFSIAGVSKKKSLGRATGFEDKTQGTLFFDVCTILKQRRPKAFLLENVKNLCSHDKGNTFKVICESLEELNYDVFFEVLDGRFFVPQHRERILLVGFDRQRYGSGVEFKFDIRKNEPFPTMADILEPTPDSRYTLSDKLWNYLQRYAEKHKAAGNGFGFGIAPRNGISRTLSARYYKDGSEILIKQANANPRRLTPRECARLMGYPNEFKIVVSDCQAYRQFGNSVVMPLMADVGRLIVKKIEELESEKNRR